MILEELPVALLVPEVSDQVSNEIDIELLEEFGEELERDVAAILDPSSGLLAPGVRLKPQDRLRKYLELILEAFPEYEDVVLPTGETVPIRDPGMAQRRIAEAEMLNDPQFRSKARSGIYPPPSAEPWITLYPFKAAFDAVAADYRSVYRAA